MATVLELRGRDQLRREGGFWMFQALRNEVVRVIASLLYRIWLMTPSAPRLPTKEDETPFCPDRYV